MKTRVLLSVFSTVLFLTPFTPARAESALGLFTSTGTNYSRYHLQYEHDFESTWDTSLGLSYANSNETKRFESALFLGWTGGDTTRIEGGLSFGLWPSDQLIFLGLQLNFSRHLLDGILIPNLSLGQTRYSPFTMKRDSGMSASGPSASSSESLTQTSVGASLEVSVTPRLSVIFGRTQYFFDRDVSAFLSQASESTATWQDTVLGSAMFGSVSFAEYFNFVSLNVAVFPSWSLAPEISTSKDATTGIGNWGLKLKSTHQLFEAWRVSLEYEEIYYPDQDPLRSGGAGVIFNF